jgi:hypothetical protein
MRTLASFVAIALFAGLAHADLPPTQVRASPIHDPFAAPRAPTQPAIPTAEPIEPARVDLRVVNDPSAVRYRDTFHRRRSHVALGVGMMIAGVASMFLIGPFCIPVIGAGFAVTVTAPLDRERTVITPPSTKQVGMAFSGRF